MAKHSGNLNKEYNTPVLYEDEEPILDRLKAQLEDLYKDIELNYRRVYYKNPMVNMMLIMMANVLKEFIKMLDTPEEIQTSDEPFTAKNKFSFGTSKKDFV